MQVVRRMPAIRIGILNLCTPSPCRAIHTTWYLVPGIGIFNLQEVVGRKEVVVTHNFDVDQNSELKCQKRSEKDCKKRLFGGVWRCSKYVPGTCT